MNDVFSWLAYSWTVVWDDIHYHKDFDDIKIDDSVSIVISYASVVFQIIVVIVGIISLFI